MWQARRYVLGLTGLAFWPMAGQAQAPNVRFEHLTVKDGLPVSDVYSIGRDGRGFMWFGTRRCPVRYDGYSFRSFLRPDTYLVTGVARDAAGRMWFATDQRGLCRLHPDSLRLTSVRPAPAFTGHLFLDRRGVAWYATDDGIRRFDPRTGQTRAYRLRQTTYYGLKVNGFLEDRQGTLWAIGSDNGLFRHDRQTDRFVCSLGPDAPRPDRRVHPQFLYLASGCVGRDGLLYIGSYGRGLLRVDPRTEQFSFLPTPGNTVTCVAEGVDEIGRRVLWLGDNRGLLAFRPETGRFFRMPEVPEVFVHALHRDTTNGILWAGTSNGILKYNPQDNLIRSVMLPPGLVHPPVTVSVIRADRTDTTGQTFWLGLSHTGLLRWHRPTNRFTLIRYPSDRAETMWMDQAADGRLWIGLRRWDYRGDGVVVYDPRAHRYVPEPAARRAATLFSVPFVDYGFLDLQQRLWVGNTDEGVRVLDTRTGQPLRYWPDSAALQLHYSNNFLTGLAPTATGRVWLSTYQGLHYVEPPTYRFTPADVPGAPADLAMNGLLVARNGHVWGARWGSITESAPDGRMLRELPAHRGFYDRENRRLAEDGRGHIWIGNIEGLHRYVPATGQLLRFTVSEGLLRNNATAALYVHPTDATLFVGQPNGFNTLSISALDRPLALPPVVVSTFRVRQRERVIVPGHPVELARDDNAFSVEFAAPTYSRLPHVQYAYFLEGLDKRWTRSGSEHHADYTNLPPGRYVLHLNVADAFGRWHRQPLQLPIVVRPALYETWWFQGLAGLAVVGGLYALYRYRVSQLLRLQRVRTRISADLHDEIGASLSGIGILGTMARQTLPPEHPSGTMVERIVGEARQLSSTLDDIVWGINPQNDELASLLARMNRHAAELFEGAGLLYEAHLPGDLNALRLSMDARREFYLLFKEAVNNVVKHAHATRARLDVTLAHKRLRMELADNGIGFDPTARTDRNGLRNMQARARHLHGQLVVHSAPGAGTRYVLDFPLTT